MTLPNEKPTSADPVPADDRSHSTITIVDTQSFSPARPESSEPTSSASTPGSKSSSTNSVARYEIRSQLGSGGFGTVSLAWDTTLQREVAIKRPAALLDPEMTQSFLAEARLAAKVKHPGIIVVHDVGLDHEGGPFIVYEYLAGSNLKQRLANQSFSLREAIQITLTLAEALAAAHQQGLTHRDLKPANILIDEHGQPHIADFGLATEHEEQNGLRGQVAGTNRYMSPEQVRGEAHHLDGRTDLWSLGVIFYELLTGKTPFPGSKQPDVFDQILNREPRPPRQWLETIPKPVEQIVLKLLSKSVAQRYSSASDVADDLRACLVTVEESLPPAAAVRAQLLTPFRGLTPMRSAIAVLLVAILCYGGWRVGSRTAALTARGRDSQNLVQELAKPLSDGDFQDGLWTPLLRQEPWNIVFNRGDRKFFKDEEIWAKTDNQVLLQLGTTQAPTFSYRVELQPETWDGEAGIFIGFQKSERAADSDTTTLLTVVQRMDSKITLQLRTIDFERQSNQYPVTMRLSAVVSPVADFPPDGKVQVQVDVRNDKIVAIALNGNTQKLDGSDTAQFPTTGKFGVFVLDSACKFSHSEFRISN